MAAIKRRLKVPKDVESVHTAVVAGYFVEGHAYAEDIRELLRDKPKARGIAVPGLPRGAPGREQSARRHRGRGLQAHQPPPRRRTRRASAVLLATQLWLQRAGMVLCRRWPA